MGIQYMLTDEEIVKEVRHTTDALVAARDVAGLQKEIARLDRLQREALHAAREWGKSSCDVELYGDELANKFAYVSWEWTERARRYRLQKERFESALIGARGYQRRWFANEDGNFRYVAADGTVVGTVVPEAVGHYFYRDVMQYYPMW